MSSRPTRLDVQRAIGTWRVRLAAMTALAAAAVVIAAVRVSLSPDSGAPLRARSAVTAANTRQDTTTDAAIDDAVDSDPFDPSRQRPGARYGESLASIPVTPAGTTAASSLRLVGTVVDGDASFAVCQLDNGSPKIVHLRGRIGTYHLRTVSQGAAVFVTENGDRLELRVARSSG